MASVTDLLVGSSWTDIIKVKWCLRRHEAQESCVPLGCCLSLSENREPWRKLCSTLGKLLLQYCADQRWTSTWLSELLLACRNNVVSSVSVRGLRQGQPYLTRVAAATPCMACTSADPAVRHHDRFHQVQGVFFRATTAEEAQKLGVVGWVMNTPKGSVKGEAQGANVNMTSFKAFLQHKGSPGSRIDRCDITDERGLDNLTFDSFEVRR